VNKKEFKFFLSNNKTITNRELFISILKTTRDGPVQKKIVNNDTPIPTQAVDEMLMKMTQANLIQLENGLVKVSTVQRVKIAIKAVTLGADFERVCKSLNWMEFEKIAAKAFEANDFRVKKCFRFKWEGKRREIDILGFKKPIVVCTDCKHWLRGWRKSAIINAVNSQVERTSILAQAFPALYKKIMKCEWYHATFIPVVLSLVPGPFKTHKGAPVVPIFQLQNFLSELLAHINLLTHFYVDL